MRNNLFVVTLNITSGYETWDFPGRRRERKDSMKNGHSTESHVAREI